MPPRKAAAKKAAAPLGTTSPEALASGNPAGALFAAAAQAAGAQPGTRMPGTTSAPAAGGTFSPQVPQSQPVRVEVRIDGRVRFANAVYDPTFEITDEQIVLTADLQPTWIDPPKLRAPTRFIEQEDERNGTEIIQRVHDGRRHIIEGEQ